MSENSEAPRPKLGRAMAELLVVFIGLPVALALAWLPGPALIWLIAVTALGWCWLGAGRGQLFRSAWRRPLTKTAWRSVWLPWVVTVPLLAVTLWLVKPEWVFSLVKQRPGLWVALMVAYPFISVLPQEGLYRLCFFRRYGALFPDTRTLLFANALVFSAAHLVFHNLPAVALTLLGGWKFAATYHRTGSLKLVLLEHALYGWALFTLGYHPWFMAGTLRLFEG
jgi:membrane protease YdiL (CAAX protease family)